MGYSPSCCFPLKLIHGQIDLLGPNSNLIYTLLRQIKVLSALLYCWYPARAFLSGKLFSIFEVVCIKYFT